MKNWDVERVQTERMIFIQHQGEKHPHVVRNTLIMGISHRDALSYVLAVQVVKLPLWRSANASPLTLAQSLMMSCLLNPLSSQLPTTQ